MRRAAGVALVLLACAALAGAAPPAPAGEGVVFTITLDDVIYPIAAHYLKESLTRANEQGAALVIIKLNTPGGLVSSMEEMITAITSSRAPVVVFVNGTKAASAGFFLTISADVAVMAPGTRIGAAHPVLAIGDLPKDSPIMAKVENDLAAYARSLATNRGRNSKAAEEAVRKSSAYTEQEALKLGLIDYVCHDEGEILRILDGRTIRRFDGRRETLRLSRVRIVSLDMTARERFLSFLADPTLALFLLFAGIVGLKIPSYGTLTIGGVACLVLGALMLFRSPEGVPGVAVARWAILSISASAAFIMAILTTLVVRVAQRRPTTGSSGIVGEEGTALTDIAPEGRVFVHGEYWNARAGRPIGKGARVRVTNVRDLRLDVEEVP